MTDDIVERLRNCENDPMWADHAEIPKRWCKEASDEIERLRDEVKRMQHVYTEGTRNAFNNSRNDALEEAARVAEMEEAAEAHEARDIACAIRRLKGKTND